MLTQCHECGERVSDKAAICPHCGVPISAAKQKTKKKKKRMRLPNGFGQITKINNNKLRKQYRAMVTVGKDSYGKPICKILKPEGYFRTYNEAYEALVEYNKNPYDLDPGMTVSQLYDKWTEEYFKTLKSTSSERTITAAWAYCSSVYNMRAKDIRARHIKGCMEEGTAIVNGVEKSPSAGVKSRIKSLFNLMLDYALEYEIVDKNYSRTFTLSNDIIQEKENSKQSHMPFDDNEMELLWNNLYNIKYVDIILIQCYSGWRPQELGLIKLDNVNLEDSIIIGGMKTSAGTNRLVPIHSRIKPLIEQKYNEAVELGSEYLLNCTDSYGHDYKLTYDKYAGRFKKVQETLNLNPNHRPHDGRMHFITMAKKYEVDEYAIKYIVGHAINDITEKVYTKRDADWLKKEIEKIR